MSCIIVVDHNESFPPELYKEADELIPSYPFHDLERAFMVAESVSEMLSTEYGCNVKCYLLDVSD